MVCQERYSRIVPSTQGTVIYRVLPPNINIHKADFLPYSKPVQDLLKTTNVRIVMTALHTLGDENLNLRDNKVLLLLGKSLFETCILLLVWVVSINTEMLILIFLGKILLFYIRYDGQRILFLLWSCR